MWILYIIGVIVVLLVVYALFYALCRKFPWVRWVLALSLAVVSYFVWQIWWISLIVFVFSYGVFLLMTSSKTKRGNNIHCLNCQHDILDIKEETDDHIDYYCPKCKTKGRIHLVR